MIRTVSIALLLFLAATAALAQAGFQGKWVTDPSGPASSLGNRNTSVRLEIEAEGNKLTGTISLGELGGDLYMISDGRLDGKQLKFRTTKTAGDQSATSEWTGELVDENTMRLSRYLDLPVVGVGPLRLEQPAPVPPPAIGQNGFAGPVSGIVTDGSNTFVPGVTVKAIPIDSNATITTVTNAAGAYAFDNLSPGKYTLTASLTGFQTQTLTDVILSQDRRYRYNFKLSISARSTIAKPPQNGDGLGPILLHRVK